jgi:hypothetical protein
LDRFKFFRKFAEKFTNQGAPPVSTTPAENLPPVSASRGGKLATATASVLDTLGKIMGTISDCLHLKVNLKKNYLFVNSTNQR